MPKKRPAERKVRNKKDLSERERVWLDAYLNTASTRFNATAAARVSHPNADEKSVSNIGHEMKVKLQPLIDKWIDEEGLSETSLKQRLLDLLDAKNTYYDRRGVEHEAPNWIARKEGLKLAMQVKGMLKPDVTDELDRLIVAGITRLAELAGSSQKAIAGPDKCIVVECEPA